jgi:hypothetical protein
MSGFTYTPMEHGIHVMCECGAEMLFPAETLTHRRPVYCPCGALDHISDEAIDALQVALMKLKIAEMSA